MSLFRLRRVAAPIVILLILVPLLLGKPFRQFFLGNKVNLDLSPYPTVLENIGQCESIETVARTIFAVVSSPDYWLQALTFARRFRFLGMQHELVLFIPLEKPCIWSTLFENAVLQAFQDANLQLQYLPIAPVPPNVKFRENSKSFRFSWNKLSLFRLRSSGYTKIIYLDLDVYLNRDFSVFVSFPAFAATLSDEGYHTEDYYHLMGGLLILEPCDRTYFELMELAHSSSNDVEYPQSWRYSEQELLSYYFQYQGRISLVLDRFMFMPVHVLMEAPNESYGKLNTFRFTKERLSMLVYIYHFVSADFKPWEGGTDPVSLAYQRDMREAESYVCCLRAKTHSVHLRYSCSHAAQLNYCTSGLIPTPL